MAKKKEQAPKEQAQQTPETNGTAAEVEQVPEIPETVTLTRDEFDQVKNRIDALQKDKDDTVAMAQRLQADFDNYRRRNAAVYADALLEGKLEVIKGLLPVLDNLDRALAGEQEGSGSLYEGLVMIRKQLIDLIHSMGVEEIGAEGEAFDPNYHNAVMQSDCASGQKPGEIAEVLIKGYKLGDKIVRHTMVRVTK